MLLFLGFPPPPNRLVLALRSWGTGDLGTRRWGALPLHVLASRRLVRCPIARSQTDGTVVSAGTARHTARLYTSTFTKVKDT